MDFESGWSIDVGDCKDTTLGELYEQLKGSNSPNKIPIQRELLKRAREKGAKTIKDLIGILIQGVPKKGRIEIAREWCEALEISEIEFKRIANQ